MALKQRHMEALKSGVENLWNDTDMADVEIHVKNRTFRCHKAILASVSPYFRAMFTGGMRETKENKITLQDTDDVVFEKFLQFVYNGKDDMIGDDVPEMLRVAAIYQVDCLQDHCEELLVEQLRVENCLELYSISCMYNCPNLRKKAWPAVLDGFCTIWKTPEFDALPVEEVIAIIKDDNLVTVDEEMASEAVLKWIHADHPKRLKHTYEVFKWIRLPHVCPEYLVNSLCKMTCLMENPECRKLVDEAQHFHLLPARRLDFSNYRMRYRSDDDLEEVLLVVTEYDEERGSFYEGGWCLWAFSFQQKRWFTLAPIPLTESPGLHFAICSHSYDLFLSGGTNSPKTLLKFESERNEWVVSTGQMKKGRSQHCMAAVGNSVYCVGGINYKLPKSNQVVGSIEEYYIPSQKWRTVGELVSAVHSAATAVCGENIYIFGGTTKKDVPCNTVQCFQTRLKESSVISNLPYIMSRIIPTTIGENIYIISMNEGGNGILKLTSEIGFEDAGFDIPTKQSLLGVTHHNGNIIFLTESNMVSGHLGQIIKVNLQTSKTEVLHSKSNACPKPIHACHRTYVDKRFLYHTYFQ